MPQTPEETALDRIRQAADSGAESLDLSNLGLTSLPPEIGQLNNLTMLVLSNNQLTSLPLEIGQLTNLLYLGLSDNLLTILPKEIGQLASLTEFYLFNNQLICLPPEIGQLTKLISLALFNNQLANLPPEIGQLTRLIKLYLFDNQLKNLPPEIGQLINLRHLYLSNNQLTDLPPEIIQLTSLTEFQLSNNQLTNLPKEIEHLTNLEDLDLSNNQLKNILPEIGQLINLRLFSVFNNQLTNLPKEVGQLSNVTGFYLFGNQLNNLPPEIGQLTNLEELVLSYNQLNNLPPEIGQLINLTKLGIDHNQLTSLPPEIGDVTNLTLLYLSDNQLMSLPREIGQLVNLTQLDLYNNQLMDLPSEIGQLANLPELSLRDNQLTSLPPEIGRLDSLMKLDLSNNQLTSLPPEIGQLTSLTQLWLQNNQLTSLPPEIGQLTNLALLDLGNNQIVTLPSEVKELASITTLYIGNNGLKNLPNEIWHLSNLTKIDLSYNQIGILPFEISQLTNLTELYISNCHLVSLPKEIWQLRTLERFYISDNPLEIAIPAKWLEDELFMGNKYPQEILAHYKRMYEEGGRELGEARVLVVGEGGVGKTSIVKRLIDNAFDDKEDTTLIVEKRPLPLGDVRAQVWDFGGQEHMHATHQFFFSGRSLYLLVFDTRGSIEQNKVEYWLTLINSYSKNAPVILVGNKCDQHEMDLEKRRLREKYPNIRGFVGTSAQTGEHIEELRQKIQEEVRTMPQVRVLFSADYLAVKEEMETLSAAHISHEQFVQICEKHGVSDEADQDTLLDLLHDLGTVLYFRDKDGNPLLPALGVLNPNWVTGGVYRIVTNAKLKDKFKGKLSTSLLREILHEPAYARHIEDIVKLLERFELCYRDDDCCYWLPSLMEKDEAADLGDFSSAMKFEYWYPELPKSVIVRFIVKVHARILDNKVWRYGAVLKLDGNTALVRADERDKRFSIYIAGEESTRRDMLAFLRAQFDEIHTMFEIPPESFIYPPQYPDLRLPFADMKTLAKSEREHKAVYQGKPVTINLRELLDGFVTPEERRKDEEREQKESGRMERERSRESKGGDTYNYNINVQGNGNNLATGERSQATQAVQNSFNTFPAEVQSSLVELIKVTESLLEKAAESEYKDEVKEELESLQTEAKKSKPKKERVKVTVEGLKKAAENLKDIGVPVITLAVKVLALLNAMP
jgi:small GTP-binding protein